MGWSWCKMIFTFCNFGVVFLILSSKWSRLWAFYSLVFVCSIKWIPFVLYVSQIMLTTTFLENAIDVVIFLVQAHLLNLSSLSVVIFRRKPGFFRSNNLHTYNNIKFVLNWSKYCWDFLDHHQQIRQPPTLDTTLSCLIRYVKCTVAILLKRLQY